MKKVLFANLALLLLSVVAIYACKSNTNVTAVKSASNMDSVFVAFYNVENLYDCVDNDVVGDEDFTPSGKYKWTEEKLSLKLTHISEVLNAMPGDLPVFVGFAEIENRGVLERLVKQPGLLAGEYEIIHRDSPDERGIDVAAIYTKSAIKIESYNYLTVTLPDTTDRTRDVLEVKANLKGEIVYYFVNHWPSRRSGQTESDASRMAAALVVRQRMDSILDLNPNAKILLMGDFNDYPVDRSITEGLQAGIDAKNSLFNFMYSNHVNGVGSYYYKGNWGALDQFIGSKAFLESTNGWSIAKGDANFLNIPLVMFTDDAGVKRPNRTYVGDSYVAGYSDHLSIYIKLKK